MCKIKFELLGVVSERAVILEALIADRLSWSKFRDNAGRTYCYFTVEDVAEKFQIGLTQAKQAFKELETAGLIVRKRSGQGKPSKIYIQTDGKPTAKTDGKPTAKTDGKPTAKTDGNPPPIDDNISCYNISSSSGENCENQTSFDDIFLEMTTKDAVAKIVAEVVSENSSEFAEITAKIADFVAENVRNAMKNQKVRNIRAYVRACLMHAKTDYDASCDASGTDSGYGATYDISLYENYSAADSPEWNNDERGW